MIYLKVPVTMANKTKILINLTMLEANKAQRRIIKLETKLNTNKQLTQKNRILQNWQFESSLYSFYDK